MGLFTVDRKWVEDGTSLFDNYTILNYNMAYYLFQIGAISKSEFDIQWNNLRTFCFTEFQGHTESEKHTIGGGNWPSTTGLILPDYSLSPSGVEDFTSWQQDDNAGVYSPNGWVDPVTGIFHPAGWEGNIWFWPQGSTNQILTSTNKRRASMIYKDGGPGHYREFQHRFFMRVRPTARFYRDQPIDLSNLNGLNTSFYGLANKKLSLHGLYSSTHYDDDGNIINHTLFDEHTPPIEYSNSSHADFFGLIYQHTNNAGHIQWVFPSENLVGVTETDSQFHNTTHRRDRNFLTNRSTIIGRPGARDGLFPFIWKAYATDIVKRNFNNVMRTDEWDLYIVVERIGPKVFVFVHQPREIVNITNATIQNATWHSPNYGRHTFNLWLQARDFWTMVPDVADPDYKFHYDIAFTRQSTPQPPRPIPWEDIVTLPYWLTAVYGFTVEEDLTWRYLYGFNNNFNYVPGQEDPVAASRYHLTDDRISGVVRDLQTFDNIVNGQPDLFIGSREGTTKNIDLYTKGLTPTIDTITLHALGPVQSIDNVTLYTISGQDNTLPLVIWNLNKADGIPLYAFSEVTPTTTTSTLFTYDGTGLEDFTTYTVDDGKGYQTDKFSYNRIDADLKADWESWLYSDKGPNFFPTQFEVFFEFELHDVGGGSADLIAFTNTITPPGSWWAGFAEAISVRLTGDGRIKLVNYEDHTESSTYNLNTRKWQHLYCTFKRDFVDTGGGTYEAAAIIEVYTDRSKLDLIFTDYVLVDDGQRYRYIGAASIINVGNPLKTIEFVVENVNITSADSFARTLYVYGEDTINATALLHIYGWGFDENNTIELSTFGGSGGVTYGLFTDLPLIIFDNQMFSRGIPLYLVNDESSILFPGEDLNLSMVGMGDLIFDSLTLYVHQEAIFSSMPLWTKAPGKIKNAGAANDDFPIYVYRPSDASAITLMVFNDTTSVNTFMPLHTNAILGIETDSMTLAMPETLAGVPNVYIELYVAGGVEVTQAMTLAMPDTLDIATTSMDLVCYHGGGAPNTYTTLYVFGAYLETDNIELVMPEVTDTPISELNLYTNGY
jgi:hypothetical protein